MTIVKEIFRLPINYETWMKRYFIPIQKCRTYIPKIRKINNAFVSSQGLVLKNNFLVQKCAFNLLGYEDNTFYLSFWRLALEQKLVCEFGSSLQFVKLNNDYEYLLIHSKWFNYSFWINSFLLRLIMAEESGLLSKVKLIYPKEWDKIPYVTESLACFNIKKEIIPLDHHLFVKKLYMPETREWTSSFYSEHIKKVKEKIIPFALKNTSLKYFPKNIYLTRKKRVTRCIENEEYLLPIIKKYDFEIINFEDYSFWDQVALMHNAKTFVSIHGAGFSNILFMPKESNVMELVNQTYADLEYKFPFWKLAITCEHNYFVQFGQVHSEASRFLRRGSEHDNEKRYLADENIFIDSVLFEKNLQLMLK